MTIKQWLSRARVCDREITVLMKAMERERGRILSITAQLDGDMVTHTADPHKFDSYVELMDSINQRIDALYAIKNEVKDLIERVEDDRLREILLLRYVSLMTLEEIAVSMSYSYVHVCRLHGDALVAADAIWRKMI